MSVEDGSYVYYFFKTFGYSIDVNRVSIFSTVVVTWVLLEQIAVSMIVPKSMIALEMALVWNRIFVRAKWVLKAMCLEFSCETRSRCSGQSKQLMIRVN